MSNEKSLGTHLLIDEAVKYSLILPSGQRHFVFSEQSLLEFMKRNHNRGFNHAMDSILQNPQLNLSEEKRTLIESMKCQ